MKSALWEAWVDLHALLSIPYLLEAEAFEARPGEWVVRLAYPELPGCTAEGLIVEDVLQDLERQRIAMIIELVKAGKEPPIPRPPLAASDPLWTARDLGFLDHDIALLAGKPN